MRMWMVDPRILCRAHLLGEHRELHALLGIIRKGKSVKGYVIRNLVEIHKIEERHDLIANEIIRRGYKHMTPLQVQLNELFTAGTVSVKESLRELRNRCSNCKV